MEKDLIDLFNIKKNGSYAIVGTAKNAGKTTVLNHLLQSTKERGEIAGVTSIGWDGENIDRVYKTSKPSVYLPSNFFAATTKDLLTFSSSLFKICEDTRIETILGNIYIIQSLSDIKIELIGPRDLKSMKKLFKRFEKQVDYTFLDGAVDRISSASPFFTDGFILCIASSFFRSAVEFENQVKLIKRKYDLGLKPFNLSLPLGHIDLLDKNRIVLGDKENYYYLNISNPLEDENSLLSNIEGNNWIYFPGALTDMIVEKLSSIFVDISIILDDFTKNFLTLRSLNFLEHRNCAIYYIAQSKLSGITVSSFVPDKPSILSSKLMIKIVKSIFEEIPVIDLFYE